MAARYRVIKQIGSGGMGRVYLAHDNLLERDVALKELRIPEHFSEEERREMHERFQLEARAAARLTHPHIVTVHDIVASGDRYFIVMEYLNGKTLGDILSEKVLSQDELLSIAPMLCDALGYAHSQGVIHRDVKPDNIFALENGNVKITDFGIAKLIKVKGVTQTGMITGTPQYIAPEVVRDRPYDHRVDIFALGVTFYELLSGSPPFDGETDYAVIYKVASEPPPPLEEKVPDINPRLARIISRALEKEPSLRFADMQELRDELMSVRNEMGMSEGAAEEDASFDLERAREAELAVSAAADLGSPVEYAPSGQFYFHRDQHWRERIAEIYRLKEEEKEKIERRLFPQEGEGGSSGPSIGYDAALKEATAGMGIGHPPAAGAASPARPSPSRGGLSVPYADSRAPQPRKTPIPIAAPEEHKTLIAWCIANILFCLLAVLSVELTWVKRIAASPSHFGISYPEGICVLALMTLNLAFTIALLAGWRSPVANSRGMTTTATLAFTAACVFVLVRLVLGKGIAAGAPTGLARLGEVGGYGAWMAVGTCLLCLICSSQASRNAA